MVSPIETKQNAPGDAVAHRGEPRAVVVSLESEYTCADLIDPIPRKDPFGANAISVTYEVLTDAYDRKAAGMKNRAAIALLCHGMVTPPMVVVITYGLVPTLVPWTLNAPFVQS